MKVLENSKVQVLTWELFLTGPILKYEQSTLNFVQKHDSIRTQTTKCCLQSP